MDLRTNLRIKLEFKKDIPMKDKILFATIFFVLIVNSSFCKNNFRSGFIITFEKDTIVGQVDYRSDKKNYNSCIFKAEHEEREYYPNEILGFGYYDDKFFLSQIVEGSFVEVLVSGEMSLFKSLDKYHLKKDGNVYNLELFFEEVKKDGTVHLIENTRWRGILSYLISDCMSDHRSIASNLKTKERSLIELVVTYNKCKGLDPKEFKANKPWTKFDFGATVGIARSGILIRKKLESASYLGDSYNSIDPSIGVVFDISSPRMTERVAFQGELHFIKHSYSSLVLVKKYSLREYHDTYIDLSSLSIPLSFKYSFPERKNGFYLQGGINLDYHLTSRTKLLTERIICNVVNTSPERSAFKINKEQIGCWGGIGMFRSFPKFKASVALRYFQISPLHKSEDFTATSSRFFMNLILYKK